MKKIFFVVLPFFAFFCSAQEKGSVVVNWSESNRFEYGDSTYTIPQFASNSFVFDEQNKSIFFNLKIATSALVDENSLQITNVIYETINENKLGDLSKQAIPNALKTTLENYISRDRFFGLLTLSPIIKDGSNYKKIKSFDYTFNEASTAYKTNFNAQNNADFPKELVNLFITELIQQKNFWFIKELKQIQKGPYIRSIMLFQELLSIGNPHPYNRILQLV